MYSLGLKLNGYFGKYDHSLGAAIEAELLDLNSHFIHLKEMVRADSEQETSLQKLSSVAEDLQSKVHEIMKVPHSDPHRYQLETTKLGEVILADVSTSVNLASQFIELEKNSIQAAEIAKVRALYLAKNVLMLGLGTNIAIALWLVLIFNHRTNERLKVLVENTLRLSRKETLNPPLTGRDELAAIDTSFHDMANSLLQLEQLKQQFVAMVSHDLRTPLTSLQMLLSLFAQGYYDASPVIQERSLAAEFDIKRLVSMINDLIDIDKFESGSIKLNLGPTAMSDVFAAAVNSVTTFANESGIKFQIEPTDLKVLADQSRLIQVVVNLLSNAIKFSPRDSLVRISACEDATQQVMVRIEDRGRGIPPELLSSVFDRFVQVNASDAEEKGGSGLGLAICKQIIEAHGGTIGIESKPDEGSCFWFKIPAISD